MWTCSRSKAPPTGLRLPRRRSRPPPPSCTGNATGAAPRSLPDNTKERSMRWCHDELTLEDMLSDPLIETLMRADGVDAGELRPALSEIAELVSSREDAGL